MKLWEVHKEFQAEIINTTFQLLRLLALWMHYCYLIFMKSLLPTYSCVCIKLSRYNQQSLTLSPCQISYVLCGSLVIAIKLKVKEHFYIAACYFIFYRKLPYWKFNMFERSIR